MRLHTSIKTESLARKVLALVLLLALTACDPPKKDSPECKAAKDGAVQLCCGGAEGPTIVPASLASLPTSCDCSGGSCVPSNFVQIKCIVKPNPLQFPGHSSGSCPDPALVDPNDPAFSQSCVDSLAHVQNSCGEEGDYALVPWGEGGLSQARPYCESVQAWASQFECNPLAANEEFPLIDPVTQQAFDLSFEYDGDGLWLVPDPKSYPNDPAPLPQPFSQGEDPNEPIRVMRTEIPGNFLRFHLAQAAFAEVFKNVNNLQPQGMANCDPAALICRFDPMKIVKWDQILRDLATGDALSWDVSDAGDSYVISDIRFKATDPDSFSASGHYHGEVQIRSDGDIVVDFRNAAYLGLLPLHDPRSENGYATSLASLDRRASYAGSTTVHFGIEKAACDGIKGYKLPDTSVEMHDKYYTYATPYRCSCDSTDANQNYCVVDPYPRAQGIAVPGDPRLVYCSASDPLSTLPIGDQTYWVEWNPLSPLPATHTTEEIQLDNWAMGHGMNGGQLTKLKADIHDFGCNGRFAERLMLEDQIQLDPDLPAVGRKVSSAVALQAALEIEIPDLIVEVIDGPMDLDFAMGVHLEKWIEDYVPPPFSWLVEWMLEIFEGLAEMFFDTAMMFLGDVNTAHIGDQEVLVQGILSHGWQETPVEGDFNTKVVTPELEVGLRRIASNVPSVDIDFFGVGLEFTVYECDLSDVGSWLPENPLGFLMQVFGCAVPMVHNIADFVSYPIQLLISEISDKVLNAALQPGKVIMTELVATVSDLEDDNNLGDMIADTMRGVTLIPYYMQGDQMPGNAPAELGVNIGGLDIPSQAELMGRTLPPPWSQLCLGTADASFQCLLAKLFVGSANPYNPQIDIVRMGGKTHYRSFGDIALGTPITEGDYTLSGLSWDYPPTRYCTPGDTPAGAPAFGSNLRAFSSLSTYLNFGNPDAQEQLSDFDEIQVSSASNPKPLDWRSQCAAFFDFKITSRYLMDAATWIGGFPFYIDLRAQPTKRTNFLVNEVFTCQNDADCDLLDQPIHDRAELAMCSAMADMWFRVCMDPNDCESAGVAYENLMGAAIASDGALMIVYDALQYAESMTGSAPNVAPSLDALRGVLQGCAAELTTEGYTIPSNFVEP